METKGKGMEVEVSGIEVENPNSEEFKYKKS
jgi:hypothetical protein